MLSVNWEFRGIYGVIFFMGIAFQSVLLRYILFSCRSAVCLALVYMEYRICTSEWWEIRLEQNTILPKYDVAYV